MPLVKSKQLAKVYRDILHGKRRIIVWGIRENYFLNRWQALLPVAYLVDANWRLWGKKFDGLEVHCPEVLAQENPDTCAVIVDYDYHPVLNDIARFIDKRVRLPLLSPRSLPEIYQIVGKETSKFSLEDSRRGLKNIHKQALLAITRKRAWRKPTPLTEVAHLQSNLANFSAYKLSQVTSLLTSFGQKTPEKPVSRSQETRKILLFNSDLGHGGSERQVMNLAVALQEAGHKPSLLVLRNDKLVLHYVDFLQEHKIPFYSLMPATGHANSDVLDLIQSRLAPELQFLLWHLPTNFLSYIVSMYFFLKEQKPDLLIAYLDWPNVVAGIAGLMAGVPKIILTGRNVYPGALPHFYDATLAPMQQLYQAVMDHPNVCLANNSEAGAVSYAAWLNIDRERIQVIPNCLSRGFEKPTSRESVRHFLKLYGLSEKVPLIVGAFRLSPEKQPLVFLKVIAALRRKRPDIRVLICGEGPLEKTMRAFIKSKKLEDCVILSKATRHVRELMTAASLVLLTSEAEGAPNVLLEAQSQGTPVVSTLAGGVETILYPPLRTYLSPVGDIKGLTQSCLDLLNNESLRCRLGKEARAYVLKNFSHQKLAGHNLELAGWISRRHAKRVSCAA